MKSHGPSYRKQKRPLKRCAGCNGVGLTKGIFYEMVCDTCTGGGVVLAETGEPLPVEDLVVEMRLRLNERGARIRHLEKQLADLEPYRRKKIDADIARAAYPNRGQRRKGGHGD